jgi:hypothetical protein
MNACGLAAVGGTEAGPVGAAAAVPPGRRWKGGPHDGPVHVALLYAWLAGAE